MCAWRVVDRGGLWTRPQGVLLRLARCSACCCAGWLAGNFPHDCSLALGLGRASTAFRGAAKEVVVVVMAMVGGGGAVPGPFCCCGLSRRAAAAACCRAQDVMGSASAGPVDRCARRLVSIPRWVHAALRALSFFPFVVALVSFGLSGSWARQRVRRIAEVPMSSWGSLRARVRACAPPPPSLSPSHQPSSHVLVVGQIRPAVWLLLAALFPQFFFLPIRENEARLIARI
jgi:hypothetical protein